MVVEQMRIYVAPPPIADHDVVDHGAASSDDLYHRVSVAFGIGMEQLEHGMNTNKDELQDVGALVVVSKPAALPPHPKRPEHRATWHQSFAGFVSWAFGHDRCRATGPLG